MTRQRVGLWLVGAFGGVGTTITLGLAAMARGLCDRSGLVTELPLFDGLSLPEPGDFVIGGHDIRQTSFAESAEEFRRASGVFEPELDHQACADELEAATARVRPGTHLRGRADDRQAGRLDGGKSLRTARQAVDRIAADMAAFVASESIDHLIVLNVASTEPPFRSGRSPPALGHLERRAGRRRARAAARQLALRAGRACAAGTPTSTSRPAWAPRFPRWTSWPSSTGALHAGKDGKTGETLMKTVLAPMFALRNLKVLSWVGHNIFGNRDGLVLDDPANKSSKVETKDRVITQILGYKPASVVTIEYLRRHGRLEDGLGPHSLPGLPGHEDGPPVHLAGLRQPAGRPAGDRPGAAGRPSRSGGAAAG